MKAKGKISSTENKTQTTTSTLMRWTGVSAMLAGLCFIVIGLFHPVNVPSAVTTQTWVNVHIFAFAMGFLGVFGMAGLYVRQAEKSRWLGLAGFILLSVWMVLVSGFSFVEAFILPHMVTESPELVAGFLGIFTGVPSQIDLGILPTLTKIADSGYLLGTLLFGIATFRAGILPRWAGVLFIVGALLAPVGAAIPAEHQPKVMVPNGLALIWLGYALFSERRAKASESLLDQTTVKAEPSKVV